MKYQLKAVLLVLACLFIVGCSNSTTSNGVSQDSTVAKSGTEDSVSEQSQDASDDDTSSVTDWVLVSF